MKKGLIIFCILFSFPIISIAQTIYVSSSNGFDSNSGLSSETPVTTIAEGLKRGTHILLMAGDVFFESVELKNKSLSAFGGSDRPVISGYKRIINPNWERICEDIWRIDLAADNYSGFRIKGSSLLNNIGCIHNYETGVIYGRKVKEFKDLKNNWDIWQTNRFDKNTPASSYDYLYLFLDENPNALKLEFSTGQIALKLKESSVDGVKIEGFGFGISCGTKVIIKNCVIDAIGGMIQRGYSVFTPYGNGIEFWISNISRGDSEVSNCIISRCYDCGITIQGRPAAGIRPYNIDIHNNFIYNCCQGFESFLLNHDTKSVYYDNCRFRNNIVLASGDSGFDYSDGRFKYCHVLGNDIWGNKGMIIENNTFVGGNYYCSGAYEGEYKSNVWRGNKCYIKRGDFILSNYTGSKDVLRIPKNRAKDASVISKYRALTGDQTTVFKIYSEKKINRKINRLKNRYIK
jgi:hypothetical protein